MITPRELFDQAEALLLDFDGPMAQLMPPPLNRQAADFVRIALGEDTPPELMDTSNHIALLTHPEISRQARLRAEQAATAFEIECANTCQPAIWLPDLIDYAQRHALPCAVVTNNSPQSVRTFLRRTNAIATIEVVCGRTPDTIHELKPHPRYLLDALEQLGAAAVRGLFIGDSASDVHAGIAAGVPVLGYAKNSARAARLTAAGAAAIFHADGQPTRNTFTDAV